MRHMACCFYESLSSHWQTCSQTTHRCAVSLFKSCGMNENIPTSYQLLVMFGIDKVIYRYRFCIFSRFHWTVFSLPSSLPWSVPGNIPGAIPDCNIVGSSQLRPSEAPEAQQQRKRQRCQAQAVALSPQARPQQRQHGGGHARGAWPGLEMGKPGWWRGPRGHRGGDWAAGQHYHTRQDSGGAVGQRHTNQLPHWLPGFLWPAALW